jgi:hypothetical protein
VIFYVCDRNVAGHVCNASTKFAENIHVSNVNVLLVLCLTPVPRTLKQYLCEALATVPVFDSLPLISSFVDQVGEYSTARLLGPRVDAPTFGPSEAARLFIMSEDMHRYLRITGGKFCSNHVTIQCTVQDSCHSGNIFFL